jgi:hypothetical protein
MNPAITQPANTTTPTARPRSGRPNSHPAATKGKNQRHAEQTRLTKSLGGPEWLFANTIAANQIAIQKIANNKFCNVN